MDKQVELPKLAESVVEAEILEWRVAEGQRVERDQPLVEVASDKVTVELPSPYAGTLAAQLVQVGDTVAVGTPVARISEQDADRGEPGAEAAGEQSPSQAPAAEPSDADGRAATTNASEAASDDDSLSLFKPSSGAAPAVQNPFLDKPSASARDDSARVAGAGLRAVPAARIAARRLGVDIAEVSGSGAAGRIRVADVQRHAERGSAPDRSRASDGLAPLAYEAPAGYRERERRVPLRGTRRAIARQMSASHLHAVRTLVVEEADMTRLQAFRAALRERAAERGVRLSFLPFVFKALVLALKDYPEVNSSLDEAHNEIVYKDYYNVGLAVATDKGLMVPVVRDVDARTLIQVAAEVNRLAAGARDGGLGADELRGSTCSVTNIGSVGALMSFPIINVPDAAILGVHSIRERPVAIDGAVHVRPMMYLSLSFDHRLVDGARAALFLQTVIGLLERPETLLLDAV